MIYELENLFYNIFIDKRRDCLRYCVTFISEIGQVYIAHMLCFD